MELTLPFRKNKIRSYRRALKGCSRLIKENRFGIWRDLRVKFMETPPTKKTKMYSKIIFGSSHPYAQTIIHQYCFDFFINKKNWLGNSILEAVYNDSTYIRDPLPFVWQKKLIEFSFKVNKAFSIFSFSFYIFYYFVKNFLTILGIIARSIYNWKENQRIQSPSVHFLGLQKNNIPDGENNRNGLISWYLQSRVKHSNIKFIYHDVPNVGEIELEDVIIKFHSGSFRLSNLKTLVSYLLWAFTSVTISLFDLFRGNWWHALILGESAKAKAVSLSSNKDLASSYLFHYSSQSYRPIWTYEAEKKNIEIVCYFYSTFDDIKLPERPVNQNYIFLLYNWPITWVWDSIQLENIQRCSSFPIEGKIVGPIWFNDSNEIIPNPGTHCVAVFDIQPQRKYFYHGYSCLSEYFENFPDLHKQFLQDIFTCCLSLEVKMIHKVKRDIGIRSNKQYYGIIRSLQETSTYVSVKPNVSALKVINSCTAIISAPFTSTALYGRIQNKPSAYYDPTGWIQKDDPAAHGITILSGKQELAEWLNKVFLS